MSKQFAMSQCHLFAGFAFHGGSLSFRLPLVRYYGNGNNRVPSLPFRILLNGEQAAGEETFLREIWYVSPSLAPRQIKLNDR